MSARRIDLGWHPDMDDHSEREYEPIAKIEYIDHESRRGYGSGPDVISGTLYRDEITGLAVADIRAFEGWLKRTRMDVQS